MSSDGWWPFSPFCAIPSAPNLKRRKKKRNEQQENSHRFRDSILHSLPADEMFFCLLNWPDHVTNGHPHCSAQWKECPMTYCASGDVNPQVGGGGESAAIVLLRLAHDDVQFGTEQQNQRHQRPTTSILSK